MGKFIFHDVVGVVTRREAGVVNGTAGIRIQAAIAVNTNTRTFELGVVIRVIDAVDGVAQGGGNLRSAAGGVLPFKAAGGCRISITYVKTAGRDIDHFNSEDLDPHRIAVEDAIGAIGPTHLIITPKIGAGTAAVTINKNTLISRPGLRKSQLTAGGRNRTGIKQGAVRPGVPRNAIPFGKFSKDPGGIPIGG